MSGKERAARDTARPDEELTAEPTAEARAGGVDTADLENAAELTLTAFCWWRSDIPQEVCEAYWRDVHGIMFARVAGLWQRRRPRLAANRPDLRPAVRGTVVSGQCPAVADFPW